MVSKRQREQRKNATAALIQHFKKGRVEQRIGDNWDPIRISWGITKNDTENDTEDRTNDSGTENDFGTEDVDRSNKENNADNEAIWFWNKSADDSGSNPEESEGRRSDIEDLETESQIPTGAKTDGSLRTMSLK